MRTSQLLMPTEKETPQDAELASHQLLIRAGYIRKLGSGIYSWLPLGLKVLHRVSEIVREEMDKAGAQEILMPAIQPAEIWQETGRWDVYGPMLLKMKDRNEREFCFGPTHEEVVTDITRKVLRSYKQLPLTVYQIQTKFRDEIRPRFGLMRAREFVMKDAYSFHEDEASLVETYQSLYQAYCQIFERLGLDYRVVEADSGEIGGQCSHEFHVLAQSGEDELVYAPNGEYAANVETATTLLPTSLSQGALQGVEPVITVETPGIKSTVAQCEHMGIQTQQMLKTLLVRGATETAPVVGLVIRGDHELNEIKAQRHPLVASPLTMISEAEVQAIANCEPGFVGVKTQVPLIVDHHAGNVAGFTCGANESDKHFANMVWGRDVDAPAESHDLITVRKGFAAPDGSGALDSCRGIEVGHIFQLGTKYSEAMGATILNAGGKSTPLTMGCYGIGVSRIVAAAIEQHHDDKGIIWPEVMAPYSVSIVPMNYHKSHRVKDLAESIYQQLADKGVRVLLEDRKERAGVLFAEHDLIGVPHRIVIGERGLDEGTVEYKHRKDTDKVVVAVDAIVEHVISTLNH